MLYCVTGASSQSLSSEASSDYVVPPEDVSIATSDTEMLEPRQKVLRLTSAVMDSTSPSTPLSPLPPASPSHAVLPPVPHRMSSAAYTPPASPSHKVSVFIFPAAIVLLFSIRTFQCHCALHTSIATFTFMQLLLY